MTPRAWLLSVVLSSQYAFFTAAGSDHVSGNGITLKVYSNLGLSGTPTSTEILQSTEFELPAGTPFSAELVGSVLFPAAGGTFVGVFIAGRLAYNTFYLKILVSLGV